MTFRFEPIGIIHSCFKEKFGIPRQPGLVPAATATLELLPPYDRDEALRGLEGFSHLWVVFVFHDCLEQGWSPTVRPPRLGGNERVGVFASRSNFRPNPIGLSLVGLRGFGREQGKLTLTLEGGDFLDGTPVLDIKPYLPYADACPEPRAGFAPQPPDAGLTVEFAPAAQGACAQAEKVWPEFPRLVQQILALDPRPAYRQTGTDSHNYGVRLGNLDVKWRIIGDSVLVTAILEIASADITTNKK